VTFEIGSGIPITGVFANIDWAGGPYYIKTECDPTGGTTYTINGTSQLLSVPYALYSANGTPGPQGPEGPQGPIDGGTFASRICNEYSVTVGGVNYGDWYLPSKFELNLLYLQKTVVGGFASTYYWSSTESDTIYA